MRRLDLLLARFQRWRRLRGGHWERWQIGDGRGAFELWVQPTFCTQEAAGQTRRGFRIAYPELHGTPICEDWRRP